MALQVTVLRAIDLKEVDYIGREHVYVILRVGSQEFRTETRHGVNAHFGDAFQFQPPLQSGTLEVEVLARHEFTGDRVVGRGSLPIQQVEQTGQEVTIIPLLTATGHQHGQLEVSMSFQGGFYQPGARPAMAYAAPPPPQPVYGGGQNVVVQQQPGYARREETVVVQQPNPYPYGGGQTVMAVQQNPYPYGGGERVVVDERHGLFGRREETVVMQQDPYAYGGGGERVVVEEERRGPFGRREDVFVEERRW